MKQASVISLSGDDITIFKEIQCLTPRYVCFCLFLGVIVYISAYAYTPSPLATYLHVMPGLNMQVALPTSHTLLWV